MEHLPPLLIQLLVLVGLLLAQSITSVITTRTISPLQKPMGSKAVLAVTAQK